jgi:hypothetical protein
MINESELNVGALTVSSNDSQIRAIYNSIRRSRPECTITKSFLRSEVVLTATSGVIRFPILVNDTPAANVNERRLNISDEFQVVEFGIFIYKVPLGEAIDEQILQTYANSAVFSRTGEARALQALYNGFFTITLDRKQIIPYFDCLQFQKIPDSQKGTTTAAIAGPVQYLQNYSSILNSSWGLAESLPTFRFSGAIVNEVILNANSKDMTGTNSTNYAVFFARGFLIQNGAQFKGKKIIGIDSNS